MFSLEKVVRLHGGPLSHPSPDHSGIAGLLLLFRYLKLMKQYRDAMIPECAPPVSYAVRHGLTVSGGYDASRLARPTPRFYLDEPDFPTVIPSN